MVVIDGFFPAKSFRASAWHVLSHQNLCVLFRLLNLLGSLASLLHKVDYFEILCLNSLDQVCLLEIMLFLLLINLLLSHMDRALLNLIVHKFDTFVHLINLNERRVPEFTLTSIFEDSGLWIFATFQFVKFEICVYFSKLNDLFDDWLLLDDLSQKCRIFYWYLVSLLVLIDFT